MGRTQRRGRGRVSGTRLDFQDGGLARVFRKIGPQALAARSIFRLLMRNRAALRELHPIRYGVDLRHLP